MKTVLTLVLSFFVFAGTSFAQISTPAASPTGVVKQEVGLTDITIDYSRPGVKDRVIFAEDGLVPYGQIWRTGANAATTIEFSEDVVFGGKEVPAGKYALYTIPNNEMWSVMLYSDLSLGGNTAEYDESKEVAKAEVKVHEMPMSVETFTIDIGDITDNSATLSLLWDKAYVPVELKVHTDKQVTAEIDEFVKNPMSSVSGNYLNAGWYYYTSGKDKQKAIEYISKGLEHTNSPFKFFWISRKADVQASAGDYKGAVATANKAHEAGAMAEGNAKGFYEGSVKAELDNKIKEWNSKM